MSKSIIPVEHIEGKILTIRGQKVILDADLAAIYGVKTKALNQAVKRNIDRFPLDFVFQLSRGEFESCNRSQSVTGSQKHRDPRFLPYVFTEHGAIMAANVLNSQKRELRYDQ
ncbi:MAG: ORF6N domain-containing protein [Proteobacteria bacterium]|nr:ORF6N domain-containing protein [Pseudomonadota bacterium]